MVAAIVATVAATLATPSDRSVASCTASLCHARAYHSSENPSQIARDSPALNE